MCDQSAAAALCFRTRFVLNTKNINSSSKVRTFWLVQKTVGGFKVGVRIGFRLGLLSGLGN